MLKRGELAGQDWASTSVANWLSGTRDISDSSRIGVVLLSSHLFFSERRLSLARYTQSQAASNLQEAHDVLPAQHTNQPPILHNRQLIDIPLYHKR
jgi:hypothetical protein